MITQLQYKNNLINGFITYIGSEFFEIYDVEETNRDEIKVVFFHNLIREGSKFDVSRNQYPHDVLAKFMQKKRRYESEMSKV